MRIGVKFCGGCNPRYDRGAYYRSLAADNPDHDFEIAEEGVRYDRLLVIGGCTSCCASYQQYDFDTLIKVSSPDREVSFARSRGRS